MEFTHFQQCLQKVIMSSVKIDGVAEMFNWTGLDYTGVSKKNN